MLYSGCAYSGGGMCLPTDSWLVGALDVTRWNVNDEGEFDPTDCCSEVADELIPAGASAFVIPADSLSVKKSKDVRENYNQQVYVN